MILVTVGTQLGFDRLIRIVDKAAPTLGHEVLVQTGRSRYSPVNVEARRLIGAVEFEQLVARCDKMVSHAGIGTVLMAHKHRKPLVIFPRRTKFREHRNDHQLATADALEGRPGLYVARTDEELLTLLRADLAPPSGGASEANPALLRDTLFDFIATGRMPQPPSRAAKSR